MRLWSWAGATAGTSAAVNATAATKERKVMWGPLFLAERSYMETRRRASPSGPIRGVPARRGRTAGLPAPLQLREHQLRHLLQRVEDADAGGGDGLEVRNL